MCVDTLTVSQLSSLSSVRILLHIFPRPHFFYLSQNVSTIIDLYRLHTATGLNTVNRSQQCSVNFAIISPTTTLQ